MSSRSARLLLVLVFALLVGDADAQSRPLLSEEAFTAPAGTLVLEIGQDYMHAEPNFLTGQPRDRWDGPQARLVYSPADSVELDLEWTSLIVAVDDPDFGTRSDVGDVVLRTKLRLLDEGAGRPALAARYELSLPNTSSEFGLGPDTLRMSAQFLLSKRLAATTLHLNGGIAIQGEPENPHSQNDFLDCGLAVEHQVSKRWTLLGEVTGLAGTGSPGADQRAELRLGTRFDRGRVRWDAALRRGLAEADGTWGFTVGVSWRARGGPGDAAPGDDPERPAEDPD